MLNRLHDPCPLAHLENWAENAGLLELFHIRPDDLNDDRVGRAMDAIAPYIDDTPEAVVLFCLSRFGKIDTDQILWDLTSFYFEGDHDDSEMIRFGYNRDQKKDKKQAVVELNVTAKEGIPLCHRLLPGNASDQKEALKNLETLKKRLKKKTFLLIGARALFTKPNANLRECLSVKNETFTKVEQDTSTPGRDSYLAKQGKVYKMSRTFSLIAEFLSNASSHLTGICFR